MSQPANDEFSQHLSDEESNHEEASDTGDAPKQQQQVIPQTTAISNIKVPILKKEEYDIWAMEMEHYLEYIDNKVWKKKKKLRINADAIPKELREISWNGLMQKRYEGLEKGYDRFQQLLSKLEAHGAEVSTEDANHKFLRSLPPAWSNLVMTMRTNPEIDNLSIDDLYNNLRVFEQEIQDTEEMDINWQIAMIAIRMKKFYKKTGRRVRVDGKTPVGFDKKKLECFNCHNTGHFARECTAKGTHDRKKKRDSLYQQQETGKQEKNQMGLLTMDDGIVNWGEHTEAEETNHALMAISSSNEVTLCSKTCIDSYNTLKTLCDEQMNQLGDQEAQILAYSQAMKSLKKLKRYRRIGMKAVKEKEQLQKTVDSWKDSSKNLWKLIDSGMSSNSKVGLGFEIKSNNEESPTPPLSGDYTPKPQEEIDDSLYVYGKKGPQKPEIGVSDDNSSEHSTCQSNDSEGSCGNTSEHSFETESESLSEPNEISKSRLEVTNEKDVSAPKSKEVAPSCVSHIKTPRQPLKDNQTHKVNRKNWNDMMERELGEGTSTEEHGMVDRGIFDSGCSGHMTGNKDQLEDFEEFNGGSVTFGGSKGYISGKGRIRVGNLDFDSVSFVKELGHFNLFSISQICDKQHKVLFTETECLVVSSDFKMPDENQILLKVPRHHNMYSFDMKTPSPAKGFACLIAKATSDESKLWHRRLGHINFKNLNKLVKGNLVRGLPSKGIKQEYSNARTPQQNGVAERMNRTLIEAARTMLADSLLPTTFWAEAVSTACYIFNRVRVTKPQHKTPYELLFGHKPIISYIRPFGCHVTILDTLSVLGKFDRKSDEGFLVGYSLNSKAYRVYNLVTKRVEVNLHVNFLEEKPNVKGVGYRWMFDIDYLTDSMNYIPVSLENQANNAGISEETNSAGTSQTPESIASEEKDEEVELIVVPSAVKISEEKDESRTTSTNSKTEETLTEPQKEMKDSSTNPKIQAFRRELEEIALKHLGNVPENNTTSTPSVNTGSKTVNTGRLDHDDSLMPELEIFHKPETGIFDEASYDEEGVITDFNSL
ncbi:ribonuclease H-like domain-containing protein [Tanacetum coccineum]